MKILSIFIATILLLGATATSANFVNAQNDSGQQFDIIMPQSTGVSNQQPLIDLNDQEKATLQDLLIQCPSGLFVYNGINGQIVIACLIDGVYGKLFNSFGQEIVSVDIDIDNDNGNSNNNNNDDDNNNNGKDRDRDRDCGDRGNFTKSVWEKYCNDWNNGNEPDRDCLFNPELPKCASDNGECPDGFFNNESDQCVPDHREGCPDGYHSVDDDESGQCVKDSVDCPEGMELKDGNCTYIEEEQPQNETIEETETEPLTQTFTFTEQETENIEEQEAQENSSLGEEQEQEEEENNDEEDSNESEQDDVNDTVEASGIDTGDDN